MSLLVLPLVTRIGVAACTGWLAHNFGDLEVVTNFFLFGSVSAAGAAIGAEDELHRRSDCLVSLKFAGKSLMVRGVVFKARKYPLAWAAVFLNLLFCTDADAHRLHVFHYLEGQEIHGQSYFQDGSAAIGAKVQLLDSMGNPVSEATTDEKGEFRLPLPRVGIYTLRVDAGWGHTIEERVSIPDPTHRAGAALSSPAQPDKSPTPPAKRVPSLTSTQQEGKTSPVDHSESLMLQGTSSVQVRPLEVHGTEDSPQGSLPGPDLGQVLAELRQLRGEWIAFREAEQRHRERTQLRDVLGALGYLVGIMGLLQFLLSRTRRSS